MDQLIIHPEVHDALAGHRPVVLLETAVTTSGLPRTPWCWPDLERVIECTNTWQPDAPVNLELARAMAAAVREHGAVPATCAISKGKWHVGLDPTHLEEIALDAKAEKASVTSAARAIRAGVHAGTTVSSTLAAGNLVKRVLGKGPLVMATGGIGGVHYGWATLPDISADLRVMARSPIAVVSAGVKSIVDVPATREWLESLGIPILGLGTNQLPCFIAGLESDAADIHCVQDEQEAAETVKVHWQTVDDHGGILLTVPLKPEFILPRDVVDDATEAAEQAATAAGINGPERTPFLLAHMAESTNGRSLVANIQLLINNARVASRLACCLQEPAS